MATPTNSTALAVIGFKKQLAQDYQNQITNYFSGDKEKAMKFMTAVSAAVQRDTKGNLLACDRASLMTAFMTCAELQLYPSNVTGEAYVIPYKGKAQFQLGYQGVLTLLYRAGVESVNAEIIYAKDHFEYEEGANAKLVHKPDIFAKDRGKAIGVYAIANVNGKKVFKVMSEADVMKFKALSQAKNSEYSPWNSKQDPGLFMWKKTAIKQLAKVLPKNETVYHGNIVEAIEKEDTSIQPASGALASDETAEDKELEKGYAEAAKGDLSDKEKEEIKADEAKEAEQGKLV